MKRHVMMAGMFLWLATACTTPQSYMLKGSIPGVEDGTRIELTGLNAQGEDSLLVSGSVAEGCFEIPVAESCEMAYVQIPESKQRIPLFFEPQIRKYNLESNAEGQYRVTGGALQEIWNGYEAQNARFNARKDSIEVAYRQCAREDDLFGKMHLRAVYDEVLEAQEQFEDSLLRQNDNIVAATIVWLRSKRPTTGQQLGEKVALLGPKALQTTPGKAVKQMSDRMLRIEIGKIAPDFTQNDPDGNPVSLYGTRAKVKVLDFWASWCGPCRAETPNVRRIYEKYRKDGLEIISVSLDTKRENWLKAVESDRMDWIHTSDLQGWDNAVARLYGIKSVPAIFVLDQENRIIGQNLRGKELEEVIRKVLKE